MNLNSNTTVREVAVQMPQSTRLFEKLQIDYCCGGNTPLIEACANAGLDVQQLEKLLAETQAASSKDALDFHNMTLTELIRHILDKHHVFTRTELARLDALLTKVVSVHGNNHSELREIQRLFATLRADLTLHMIKEEQILFPYILNLDRAVAQKLPAPFAPFGTVNNPVRMMMMEHDTAGDILREMRKMSKDYELPPDACISYQTLYAALVEFEQDLHQHIHLENNIVFPRAIEAEEVTWQS